MINDSMDSKILAQEERAIGRLAHETHTAIAIVQEIFLIEYEKLSVGAHIKSFLPLLAGNSVRAILNKQNARIDGGLEAVIFASRAQIGTSVSSQDRHTAGLEVVQLGGADERVDRGRTLIIWGLLQAHRSKLARQHVDARDGRGHSGVLACLRA